jgi:hypothetical protein
MAVSLVFLLSSTAWAGEGSRGKWLRRVTLAAACTASFWDVHSTAVAVRSGARELNPLLADARGRPRWGRIIGFKAGACAASAVVQERFTHNAAGKRFWTGINASSAGIFSAAAIHNLKVAGRPSQ